MVSKVIARRGDRRDRGRRPGYDCPHVGLTGRCRAAGRLATLTAVTGARTAVVWFKVCPVLLAGSAVLLLIASVH